MSLKVGDSVRFLNAVGGGRVVRIDGQMAYVEEDDGFETPVLVRECVVVAAASPLAPETIAQPAKLVEKKYDAPAPKAAPPVIETAEGNTINVQLAFEPQDIRKLSTTNFDLSVVNDSNYWLFLSVATRRRDEREWTPRFDGIIEPNMVEFLWEMANADLADVDRLVVQCVAFKRGKSYELKVPFSSDFRFEATKFVRLHCFRPNRYFETPVIAYDIVNADSPAVQFFPNPNEIRKGMASKAKADATPQQKPQSRSSKPSDEPIVVDLHASELLDTTAGLSSAEILNLQIDTFAEVMDRYRNQTGTKIVFIHGKGEGVLRAALMKELTHRYKGHDVQDASFAQYGYGATQVTIRNLVPESVPHKKKRGK